MDVLKKKVPGFRDTSCKTSSKFSSLRFQDVRLGFELAMLDSVSCSITRFENERRVSNLDILITHPRGAELLELDKSSFGLECIG